MRLSKTARVVRPHATVIVTVAVATFVLYQIITSKLVGKKILITPPRPVDAKLQRIQTGSLLQAGALQLPAVETESPNKGSNAALMQGIGVRQ